VGVLFGGTAVGGPASVADAEGSGDGGFDENGLEVAELAGRAAELHDLLAVGVGRATGYGDAG